MAPRNREDTSSVVTTLRHRRGATVHCNAVRRVDGAIPCHPTRRGHEILFTQHCYRRNVRPLSKPHPRCPEKNTWEIDWSVIFGTSSKGLTRNLFPKRDCGPKKVEQRQNLYLGKKKRMRATPTPYDLCAPTPITIYTTYCMFNAVYTYVQGRGMCMCIYIYIYINECARCRDAIMHVISLSLSLYIYI